jgi:hypothetical protein
VLCTQQILAIVLLIITVLFSVTWVAPIFLEAIKNKWRKENSIHIPFQYIRSEKEAYDGHIDFDLKAKYNNEISTANKPIMLSCVANSSEFNGNIASLEVYFQNAMAYPIKHIKRGVIEIGKLGLQKTQENNIFEAKETAFVWGKEGEYHPRCVLILENCIKLQSPTFTDIFITIHPETLAVQIQSNKAGIDLTIAVFILGLISVANIIYRLWEGTL